LLYAVQFFAGVGIGTAGIEHGVVSIDGILAIAISLHFATRHSRLLDSLSANAHGLYLVHYNFVVWLQYALLGTALFAVIKAAAVFGGTLVLSWIAVSPCSAFRSARS
jgi:surface polysaccharide O-acyltransferase-like enzyme